jgi:hypothetical protein
MIEKNETFFNVSSDYIKTMFEKYQLSIQQAVIYYAREVLRMGFDDIDESLGRWPGSSIQSFRGAVYKIQQMEAESNGRDR